MQLVLVKDFLAFLDRHTLETLEEVKGDVVPSLHFCHIGCLGDPFDDGLGGRVFIGPGVVPPAL